MSIINSRNIFIDTSHEKYGDNFTLNLGSHAINAGDGQALKLSVTQFSMYNNTYKINETNQNFRAIVSNTQGDLQAITCRMKSGNYANCHEIANAFASVLSEQILTYVRNEQNDPHISATIDSRNSTSVLPSINDTHHSGDRIFEVRIKFSANHGIDKLILQTFENDDLYLILGTDKLEKEHNIAKNSIDLHPTSCHASVPSQTELLFVGYYPMQTSTNAQVYLRCSEPNNNIEMSSFSNPLGSEDQSLPSNILGSFPMHNEFIHFESVNDEFFINLSTKYLNNLKFSLTDRRNRPLGRAYQSSSLTAAGNGRHQSENGNLFFTAVLRVDVIQKFIPRLLDTKKSPPPFNTRNQIINNLATF